MDSGILNENGNITLGPGLARATFKKVDIGGKGVYQDQVRGTLVASLPEELRLRRKGGNPPAKRPDAATCGEDPKFFADKIRECAAGVLRLARTNMYSHTLWLKAVNLAHDLYTRAYNVQWASGDGKAELKKGMKDLYMFMRFVR